MRCHYGQEETVSCVKLVPIFHSLNREEMAEVAGITRQRTFVGGVSRFMPWAIIWTVYSSSIPAG